MKFVFRYGEEYRRTRNRKGIIEVVGVRADNPEIFFLISGNQVCNGLSGSSVFNFNMAGSKSGSNFKYKYYEININKI